MYIKKGGLLFHPLSPPASLIFTGGLGKVWHRDTGIEVRRRQEDNLLDHCLHKKEGKQKESKS